MKRISVTCVVIATVCLFQSFSAQASQLTYQSPDGLRTISVNPAGLVTYESGNGTLHIRVSKDGLEIGDFSLKATNISSTPGASRFHLTVTDGRRTIEDNVVIDNVANSATSAHSEEFKTAFSRFAASRDGQLLQEAKDFIVTFGLLEKGLVPAASKTGGMSPLWSWSGCGINVLNDVASGAAMIGGCGTGACGTAYVWCCTSGASWFGAALMQTASDGNCVFM